MLNMSPRDGETGCLLMFEDMKSVNIGKDIAAVTNWSLGCL